MKNPQPILILLECFETKRLTPRDENVYLTCDVTEAQKISPRSSTCFVNGTHRAIAYKFALDWPAPNERTCKYLRNKIGHKDVTLTITSESNCDTSNAVGEYKSKLVEKQNVKLTVLYLLAIFENTIQDGVFRIQQPNSVKEEIVEEAEEFILWPSEAFELYDYYENVHCVVVRNKRFLVLPPVDLDRSPDLNDKTSRISSVHDSENGPELETFGEFSKLSPGLQHHLPEIHGVGIITPFNLSLHEWPALVTDHPLTVTSDIHLEISPAMQTEFPERFPFYTPTKSLAGEVALSHTGVETTYVSHTPIIEPGLLSTSQQDVNIHDSSYVSESQTVLDLLPIEATLFDPPCSPESILPDVNVSCTSYNANSSVPSPEVTMRNFSHSATYLDTSTHSADDTTCHDKLSHSVDDANCLVNSLHFPQRVTCIEMSQLCHDGVVSKSSLDDTVLEDHSSSRDICMNISNIQQSIHRNSQTISSPSNKFGFIEFVEAEGCDDAKDTTTFSRWKQKLDDKADILHTTADHIERLQFEIQEYMQQLGVKEDVQCETNLPCNLQIRSTDIMQSMPPKRKVKTGNNKTKPKLRTNAFRRFCAKQQQTTLERFPSLDHEKVSQLLVKKWNAMGQEERDSYELKLHKELKQVRNKHLESKNLVNDVSLCVELNTEKLRSQTREKAVCYKPWSQGPHGKCNCPTSQNTVLQKQLGQEVMWVQCDKCNKWRKLPIVVDSQNLPKKWDCTFNSDPEYNRCNAKVELTDKWHWHVIPDSCHPSKDCAGLEQTEIHNSQTEKLQINTDVSKISTAALHEHVGHKDKAQRLATLNSKKKNCTSLNYTHNFKRRLGLLKNNSKTKPSPISRKIKRLNDLENSLRVGSKHHRILNDGCLNRKNIEEEIATQPVSVVPKVPIIKSHPNITVLLEEGHSNSDNVEDMFHDPSFPVNTIHDKKQTKKDHIQCASPTTDEMDNLEDNLDHWRQQLERGIEVMHTTFKKSKNENKLLPQQANVNKCVGRQQKKQTFLQSEKMLKVQCSKCHKWRNVPAAVYMEISESWACCIDSKRKDGICDKQASPRSTIKKKMSIRQATKLQPKKNLRLDEIDVDRPTDCKYQSDDNRSDKDAVSVTGRAHKMKKSTNKGKNRSHKRTKFTENVLRRPMNAFIKFTAEFREIVAETNPNRTNREISKLLGRMWKKMTAEEKEPYVTAFQAELKTIRAEHPEWKYNSGKRWGTLGNGVDPSTIKERRLRTRKLTQLMNYRDYFSRPYAKQRKKTNEDGRNLSRIDTWKNLEESWVQCDECNKWRKLPSTVDSQNLPKKWRCSLNPDTEHNHCEAEEEVVNDQWNWHVFTSSDTESTDCVEIAQSDTKNMSSCSTSSSKLIDKVGCDRGTLAADSVNTTFAHNVKLKGTGTHGKSLQKTNNDTSNWKEQPNPKKKKKIKPLQTAAVNLFESYPSSFLKQRKTQNKIAKKIRTVSAVPSETLSVNSGQTVANSDQNHKELTFKAQHTPTVKVLVENEVGVFNHLKPSSRPGDLINDKLEELKVLDKDSQLSDNMINAELLRRLDISIKKRRQQEKIRCVKKIKTSLRPKVRTDSQTRQCKTSSKTAKSRTKKKRVLQYKGDMVIERQLRFDDDDGKNSSLVQHVNLPEKELRRNVHIVPINDTCQQNVPSGKIGNLTKVGKLKSDHCNDVIVDDLLCHEVLPEFSDIEDKTEPSLFKQRIDSNNEKQVDKNSKQDVICQVVLPEFSAIDGTSEPSLFKEHVDHNGKKQVSNNSKEQVSNNSKEQVTISITPQVCNNPKQVDNNTTQVNDNTKQMDNNMTQVTHSTKQQVGLRNNVNTNIVLKTADFRELLSCAIRNKKQLGKPCQLGATLPLHSQHSNTQSAQHFHKTPLQSCIMKDKSDHGLMKRAINNMENTELLHQQAITDCGDQLLSKVSNQSLQATVKCKLKTILKKLSLNHSNKEMHLKLKPSNSDVLQSKYGFINSVDNQSMVQADTTTNYNEKEETSPNANDATINRAAKFATIAFPEKEIEIVTTAGRQIDASNSVNNVPLGSQSINTCPAYKKYPVNNHSRFDLLLKKFYEQRRRRKCIQCSKYIKTPESVVTEHLPQTWRCSVCDAVDASNRSSVSKTAAEQENVCRPELKEANTEILLPGMAPNSSAQQSLEPVVCGFKGMNNLSVSEQTVDSNTVATTACASQVSFNMGKDKEEPIVPKKKKRLKIDDPTKLKRPMNAFIKFSREYRELVHSYFPNSTNREVSMLLGKLWRQLIPEEKEPYIAAFKLDLSQMRAEHPDWNYAPTKQTVDLVPVTEQRLRTRKIEQFLNYKDFFRRQYTKKKLEVGAPLQNCDLTLQNQDVPVCNRDGSLRNTDDVWVQCDECNKWRKLPASVESSYPLPDKWTCHLNPDLQRNCCDADEEEY